MSANTGWKVWKDICYPGRVHVPDARDPNKVNVYTFTPEDMRALERTGNQKVADLWNIPVCWEHQDVLPARLSQNPGVDLAKGVFARLKRFSRTPDGRLKALIEGTDPEDRKQIEKVGFVSPEIAWDWRDSDGKVWHGPSVTHLAVTARPVQRHQNAFGTDPDAPPPGLRVNSLENLVRMSFGNSRNAPRVAPTLRLSLAHYRGGLATGATNMADEFTGTEGKKSAWERIADSLAMCGVKIGDGANVKDADHLADLIEVACLNRPQELETEDDLPPEEELETPPPVEGDLGEPPPGAAAEPPPPIQMSANARAVADRLIARERELLIARAEKVRRSGAMKPAAGDALVEEVRTCRLSLTAQGTVQRNDTITRLEALEQVRAGATVPLRGKKTARLSQVRGVGRSPYQEDPAQDEDAIVAAYERTVGRAEE